MKLAVFDYDSTLMDGETIDFLAEDFGIRDEISEITEDAMNGRIDFFESLNRRVSLLKGLDYKKAIDICRSLPLTKGAKETVNELKKNGFIVVCFSGGFNIATSYTKEQIGLNEDFSNTLHHKNGTLTGLVSGEMMFSDSKGYMLQKIQNVLNIKKENTVAIGDGANDLSMFLHSGTKIAFCAKEALKKEANIIIETRDLQEVLHKIL
jgi:phosphoserine phosphatase